MTAVPPSPASDPQLQPYAPAPGPGRGALPAFIAYGLLLVSLFTAGLSGLLAVILAYDRKAQSGPVPATHFAFQIKLFWICFALTFAAGALGVGGVIQYLTHPQPAPQFIHAQPDMQSVRLEGPLVLPVEADTWSYRFAWTPLYLSRGVRLQLWLGGLSFAAAVLASWIGPIFGLLRLAAGQPIGRLPAKL
ncbi:MAG TPA: hypothetical protein VMU59_03070 [Caulobacteraceae bacterium]|nr:hypothetical protein [Caulobacteraceae bacterium]